MVGVRPGEEVMVGLVVALMFVAWAGLALGQSSIDALLFAQFGVELLLYVLLGVLSAAVSLVVTGLLQRTPPRSLFLTSVGPCRISGPRQVCGLQRRRRLRGTVASRQCRPARPGLLPLGDSRVGDRHTPGKRLFPCSPPAA